MPARATTRRNGTARRQEDGLLLLETLARLAAGPASVADLYARIAATLREAVPCDGLEIDLIDVDAGTVQTLFAAGEPPQSTSESRQRGISGSIALALAGSREAVVMNGRARSGDPERIPELARALNGGYKSLLAVPVMWDGGVIGGLKLWARKGRVFGSDEAHLCTLAATQLAAPLSHARSPVSPVRTTDPESHEAELLAEISRAAIAGLQIGELGSRFLNMVMGRVPFNRGVVRMVDADTGRLGDGVVVGLGSELELAASRSHAATQAVALGKVVTDGDADPEDPAPDSPIRLLGLRSAVTMPLLTDEAVVGLVTLRRLGEAGFDEREIDFLRRASAQIAPALDNARLLDEIGSLAAVVEASSDLICRADMDGRIQYMNKAGRDMLAIPAEVDVADMSIDNLLDEPSVALLSATARPAALKSGSWSGELQARRADTTTIPVEALIAVNYHRNGTLLGVSISLRDIERRKRAEDELQRLATTDPLTSLLNRHQFALMLEQAVNLSERSGEAGALIYLDLDGFKYVNDTHGHTVGDDLLRAVAGELRENVRASDVVARTGGDEFSVILHEADRSGAMRKASQLVQAVSQVSTFVGSEQVYAACSAGVVVFPVPGASVEDLVAYADLAMYRAKDAGRNQAKLYDPSEGGREIVSALQRTRTMILDAVRNDKLILYRQPIVNVKDRGVAMYEVLVRIELVQGDVKMPFDFIPQAEAMDMVQVIDERVIERSCQRWRQFADAGEELRLSINVSAKSVGPELAEYIVEQADRHSVPHGGLTFEITETAALRTEESTENFLRRLSEAGFRLAIDDFGSGATSLKQIRGLAFDILKLDGSLVQNLKSDGRDREFVRAITRLAHSAGKEVAAEFVQDDETVSFLAELGVEYAQGFYLGRPEPFPPAAARSEAASDSRAA